MRTIFLNQSGHRWRNVSYAGKAQRLLVLDPATGTKKHVALYYREAVGNFVVSYIRHKGKATPLLEWGEGQDGQIYAINNDANRYLKYATR
jgi:hypothetical protein